jgi:hypothetical protein
MSTRPYIRISWGFLALALASGCRDGVAPSSTGRIEVRVATGGADLDPDGYMIALDSARDRGTKRRIYQRAGVSEYWIVDLDARLIERWRAADVRPEIVDVYVEWTVPARGVGRLDVGRFFETVWEDSG